MATITILRIPSLFARGALTLSATPPIGIAYIAASLRQAGHHVTVVDAIGEGIDNIYPYRDKGLFVNGLSKEDLINRIPQESAYIFVSLPFSHEWPWAKEILEAVRMAHPRAVVIAGGEHATALPEFCLADCASLDYCVLGEGEITSKELVAALESNASVENIPGLAFRSSQGAIRRTNTRPRIENWGSLPRPAWDLFPLETYLRGGYSFGVNIGRTMPILASRGCPYECTFCSNKNMWGCRWIVRSPEEVLEEMEEYIQRYQIQNFDFYDLTAIVKKDWIMDMCALLLKKNLKITWQLPSGTRCEALDDEATSLLYQSGCRNISYAPESGSPRMLQIIKKKINLKHMLDSMKAAVRNGINVKANMIVGFPDESMTDVFKSYLFIVRMAMAGVHDVSVWTFCAYPGSEIFQELQRRARVPALNDEYFFSLLSYSDLKQAVSWNPRISDRRLALIRNSGLILFYALNYLFRPLRLIKTLRNIFRHSPESRLEMIVEKSLLRHKIGKSKEEACS